MTPRDEPPLMERHPQIKERHRRHREDPITFSPQIEVLFEKKSKYKKIAQKYKSQLSQREQELTDLIVENNERRHAQDRMSREHKQELERIRAENVTLMEENHRYARDIDRLHRENSDLRDKIADSVTRADRSVHDLQRILDEKSRAIEELTIELSHRQAEC